MPVFSTSRVPGLFIMRCSCAIFLFPVGLGAKMKQCNLTTSGLFWQKYISCPHVEYTSQSMMSRWSDFYFFFDFHFAASELNHQAIGLQWGFHAFELQAWFCKSNNRGRSITLPCDSNQQGCAFLPRTNTLLRSWKWMPVSSRTSLSGSSSSDLFEKLSIFSRKKQELRNMPEVESTLSSAVPWGYLTNQNIDSMEMDRHAHQ